MTRAGHDRRRLRPACRRRRPARRSPPAWCATAGLRPAANAFDYRTYFLLLPMRSLRAHACAALRRNRFGLLAFHDRDHGDGRADALAWLDELLHAEGIARRRRRSLAAHLPARAGLCLQAGELLVLPPRRRLAGGDRGRGQQHLRRAPLLPAGRRAAGLRARPAGAQGVPRLAVLPRQRAATASASCARRTPTARAAWRASTTKTPAARCCRPACRAGCAADAPPACARAFFGMPLMSFGVIARIHWQALRVWLKRVPYVNKPAAARGLRHAMKPHPSTPARHPT